MMQAQPERKLAAPAIIDGRERSAAPRHARKPADRRKRLDSGSAASPNAVNLKGCFRRFSEMPDR
jgi:hypothetical protein